VAALCQRDHGEGTRAAEKIKMAASLCGVMRARYSQRDSGSQGRCGASCMVGSGQTQAVSSVPTSDRAGRHLITIDTGAIG
jgi:hypothetical protein